MSALSIIMSDILAALHPSSTSDLLRLQQLCHSMHITHLQSFGRPGWSWDQSCDTESGLSSTCVRLIISLTSRAKSLTVHLCSSLLLIPCKYVCLVPYPTPSQYFSISNAASFVLQNNSPHTAVEELHDLLVLGGGNMIQRLCLLPMADMLHDLRAVQPNFLIQKVLLMMCKQLFKQPRDETQFQHSFSTACHIGSAHTYRLADLACDERHALMSPCFVRAARQMLHISLWRGSSVLSMETKQLIVMLSATLLHPPHRPDLHMELSRREDDSVYLHDLLTCMSRQESLAVLTLTLAGSVVVPLTVSPGGEADRQLIILLLTRMLCMHGGSLQRQQRLHQAQQLQSKLHDMHPDQGRLMRLLQLLVEHFQNVTVAALTVTSSTTFPLPYDMSMTLMRKQPGVVGVMETMLRVTCSSSGGDMASLSANGVVHMMLVNLQIFFCGTTVHVCKSMAGTVRKLVESSNKTSVDEMRQVCEMLIKSLLSREDAHTDGLMAIVASILAKSYVDEPTPAPYQRLVNSFPQGSRIRQSFVELQVETRQAVVWERYAADMFDHGCKWLLPGCSSWMCKNLGGCSERALPVRLCSGCWRAKYCSDTCQKEAWVNGHRELCHMDSTHITSANSG